MLVLHAVVFPVESVVWWEGWGVGGMGWEGCCCYGGGGGMGIAMVVVE